MANSNLDVDYLNMINCTNSTIATNDPVHENNESNFTYFGKCGLSEYFLIFMLNFFGTGTRSFLISFFKEGLCRYDS